MCHTKSQMNRWNEQWANMPKKNKKSVADRLGSLCDTSQEFTSDRHQLFMQVCHRASITVLVSRSGNSPTKERKEHFIQTWEQMRACVRETCSANQNKRSRIVAFLPVESDIVLESWGQRKHWHWQIWWRFNYRMTLPAISELLKVVVLSLLQNI